MQTILLYLAALGAGISVAVQQVVNGGLRVSLHSPAWAAFVSYLGGLLTMIVSLEAIFLSTFVMISQNRADARRQVIADQAWTTVQEEDRQNVELLDLSRQILALTKEVRAFADPAGAAASAPAKNPPK